MGKKYVIDEDTLKSIAEKLRFEFLEVLPSGDAQITPEQMPEVISRGSGYVYSRGHEEGEWIGLGVGKEQGKQEAYDAFWDSLQNYGKKTDYRYFVAQYNFTPETFKPKYPIVLCSYIFYDSQLNISLIEQGVELAPPAFASSSLGYCFRGAKITEVPTIDLSKGNACTYAFANNSYLRKIERLISAEKIDFSNAFSNATALEEIRFEGIIGKQINVSWSPLTKESILSIITHLSDTSASQTLSLKSSIVSAIDWTNTVIDEVTYNTFDEICDLKPNWTISLV